MSKMASQLESQRIVIALATYNEITNLPRLVDELTRVLPSARLLVIDDNSPDGTGGWCDEQTALGRPLVCLHRPTKNGLGRAASAGFQWAIAQRFDWIGTMDADHAHDPAVFLTMLDAVTRDPQLAAVIGSRYVAGGQTVAWPAHRRIASRLINWVARFWLRLPTRDNSSALRLYRVSALARIDAGHLKCHGYAYLEEILWRLRRAGFRVAEIPITFRQREQGESKLGMGQALVAIRDLLWLPFRR